MTKNFTFESLIKTSVGICNCPNMEEIKSLEQLTINVLQPLRDLYGKPIFVTSGFRNKAVNKAVGGVPSSQHTKGEAVDISVYTKHGNKILFHLILEHLEYDQLINENDYSWIHVSFTTKRPNRKQVLHLG